VNEHDSPGTSTDEVGVSFEYFFGLTTATPIALGCLAACRQSVMATQAGTTTIDGVSTLHPHSPMSSTSAIDITSANSEGHTFEGNRITLLSESRWLIRQALSHRVLQQTFSPCEARQVFTAIRVADPLGTYFDIEEAEVKIKYQ
jgi:hypothetical protein